MISKNVNFQYQNGNFKLVHCVFQVRLNISISNLIFTFAVVLASAVHILKLERYREDQHGPCARMTRKIVKRSTFFVRTDLIHNSYLFILFNSLMTFTLDLYILGLKTFVFEHVLMTMRLIGFESHSELFNLFFLIFWLNFFVSDFLFFCKYI